MTDHKDLFPYDSQTEIHRNYKAAGSPEIGRTASALMSQATQAEQEMRTAIERIRRELDQVESQLDKHQSTYSSSPAQIATNATQLNMSAALRNAHCQALGHLIGGDESQAMMSAIDLT